MKNENQKKPTEICTAITYTLDNSIIIAGYNSGIIRFWNVNTNKELLVLKGHKEAITSLAFSPNGKWFVSGSTDRKIILWDAFQGNIIKILKGYWGTINDLAINNNCSVLASATSDNKIRLWDLKKDNKKIHELKDHKDFVSTIAFSPSSNMLASASWDHLIYLWKVSNGKKKGELKGHFGPIRDIDFSSDGKVIISCSSDGSILLWDAEKQNLIRRITSEKTSYTAILFHPFKRIIISGSTDHSIKIWDLKTSNLLASINKHKDNIKSLRISPNGQLLVSLSVDGEIHATDIYELMKSSETNIFTRVKDVFTSDKVKQFVSSIKDSIGKVIESAEQQKVSAQQHNLKLKMKNELPDLIAMMPIGETITINDLTSRYNCSKELAEEVITELIQEEKITGAFNPFSGTFTVYYETPEQIHEENITSSTELTNTCFYCGEPIDVTLAHCPSCSKELLRCPVCKLSINFGSEIGVCSKCGTQGHYSHMKEAVKVSGFCPVCLEAVDWDTGITLMKKEGQKE